MIEKDFIASANLMKIFPFPFAWIQKWAMATYLPLSGSVLLRIRRWLYRVASHLDALIEGDFERELRELLADDLRDPDAFFGDFFIFEEW